MRAPSSETIVLTATCLTVAVVAAAAFLFAGGSRGGHSIRPRLRQNVSHAKCNGTPVGIVARVSTVDWLSCSLSRLLSVLRVCVCSCMGQDEVLFSLAEDVKNFAVVYLVDITEVPDFCSMYELYDPCTTMFFFRNKVRPPPARRVQCSALVCGLSRRVLCAAACAIAPMRASC